MPSLVLDGAFPYSLLYNSSPHLPYHLGFLGVFVMFIIWVFVMINLILVLLNVSFLVIPQFKKDIVVIVLFFVATLLALMSHLLSLFPIFLFMRLSERLPLSLMSSMFPCLFHIFLSLLCCLHHHLLLSRFMHFGHAHQLLHLYHHPPHLWIRWHLHLIPCPLPYGKVHVLALLNILSVSLYPLILYLLPFLLYFPSLYYFHPKDNA